MDSRRLRAAAADSEAAAGENMICPKCGSMNTTVKYTQQRQHYRHRRYKCLSCNARFNTQERAVDSRKTKQETGNPAEGNGVPAE